MIARLENLGVRLLNRLVPAVTASAGYCSCDPGSSWCCPRYGPWVYCYCVESNGTCYVRQARSFACP